MFFVHDDVVMGQFIKGPNIAFVLATSLYSHRKSLDIRKGLTEKDTSVKASLRNKLMAR